MPPCKLLPAKASRLFRNTGGNRYKSKSEGSHTPPIQSSEYHWEGPLSTPSEEASGHLWPKTPTKIKGAFSACFWATPNAQDLILVQSLGSSLKDYAAGDHNQVRGSLKGHTRYLLYQYQ